MKKTLLSLSVVIFCSCSSYRYMAVDSDNIPRNDKNEFVVETDLIRVTYNFHGKKGPVQINVYNKSNEALQIDWKKSAMIVNETPVAYYKPDLWINGDVDKTSSSSTRTFNGRIYREEGVEFLPPQSGVSKTGAWLGDCAEMKGLSNTIRNSHPVNFTMDNSPLVFRSYLTFTRPGKEDDNFTTDNVFYVSAISVKKGSFDIQWLNNSKKGNEFYMPYASGGHTGGMVAMGAAVSMIFVLYKNTH
jgi:hypothetical protein